MNYEREELCDKCKQEDCPRCEEKSREWVDKTKHFYNGFTVAVFVLTLIKIFNAARKKEEEK